MYDHVTHPWSIVLHDHVTHPWSIVLLVNGVTRSGASAQDERSGMFQNYSSAWDGFKRRDIE
jgi:hypothetical protein